MDWLRNIITTFHRQIVVCVDDFGSYYNGQVHDGQILQIDKLTALRHINTESADTLARACSVVITNWRREDRECFEFTTPMVTRLMFGMFGIIDIIGGEDEDGETSDYGSSEE
jgi:hypothetical protein